MKDHSAIRHLLGLSAAGALDPREQRLVEEHLRRCGECRAEVSSWNRLAEALRDLPSPQAPQDLLLETRRLLEIHAEASREPRGNRIVLAFLGMFSLIVMFLNCLFVHWLEIRLAHRLGVSSATTWVISMGVIWLATALAAGLIARLVRQEEKSI